jgi:hypothetical protein
MKSGGELTGEEEMDEVRKPGIFVPGQICLTFYDPNSLSIV